VCNFISEEGGQGWELGEEFFFLDALVVVPVGVFLVEGGKRLFR